jgi:hypothetical protein
LTARNQRYEHVVAQLNRRQFGQTLQTDGQDQLWLALEYLQQDLAEIEVEEAKADDETRPVVRASAATAADRCTITCCKWMC